MSGWKEVGKDGVKIIHHSPSSLVEIRIEESDYEYIGQSDPPKTIQKIWLSYDEYKTLKEVINQIDFL